jgi:hypothetical protein
MCFQAEADGAANAAKKQLRLSYEDYRKIANLIVHYLRKNDNDDIQKSKVRKKEILTFLFEMILFFQGWLDTC